MSDFMRKDAGKGVPKLTVTIEMDAQTGMVTVETNVYDPSVMMRLIGQAMHVWSDDEMKKRVAAVRGSAAMKRPLVLPGRQGDN